MRSLGFLILTAFAATATSAASGQVGSAGQGMFDRDRNVSVTQRPRPGYESQGVQNGAFIIRPELATGLEYNDNVFATATTEESDVILHLNPSITAESTWSRHGLFAFANVAHREYFDVSDESATDWELGAQGRIDVVRGTEINLSGAFAARTEPRTSAGAAGQAAEPIEYDQAAWFAGFERAVNRVKLGADVRLESFDYDDSPLFGGGIADQDFRDRDEVFWSVRGDYAISPDTALFLRGELNDKDYDLEPAAVPVSRDSDGYVVEGGVDFDLGGVARGAVALGYFSQEFDDPAFFDIDGLSADVRVEWFPTQLTTVNFSAGRGVEESAINAAAGYLSTYIGASIDHELRRNVIVSSGVNFGDDEYEGLDRSDDYVSFDASATYLLNRNVGVEASFQHLQQDSSGAAARADFESNRFMISLTFQM
jgi:hypothetical protein